MKAFRGKKQDMFGFGFFIYVPRQKGTFMTFCAIVTYPQLGKKAHQTSEEQSNI